jgi:hypothetical protein
MEKSIRNGVVAAVGLILFYFMVMGISSRSWSATFSQFQDVWYWMILLSVGFGTQIALFTYLKDYLKKPRVMRHSNMIAATTTGTSATAMVACCAHHLTEVLPFIGFSAASVFLTRYQIPLIIFGVVMNGLGIAYMIRQIRKVKDHITNSR